MTFEHELADLDAALAGLRNDRHGWYGAVGRGLLLRALTADTPVDALTYRVLRYVGAAPAGTVRVRHVGELLLCDRARASRVVHRFVDRGLLTLSRPSADARERQLGLGETGAALLAEADCWRRRRLAAAVAGWDPADVSALTGLLTRLHRDADRALLTVVGPHGTSVAAPDDTAATPPYSGPVDGVLGR